MYAKSFSELDKLLKIDQSRSCFSIDYAEFAKMCNRDSTTRVLSKIFYWWRANKDGDTKLCAKDKKGNLALVKSPVEMSIELGMSISTVKRAYVRLTELNLIATTTIYFRGHNTTGIILNEEVFTLAFWKAYIEIQLQLAEYYITVTKDIHKKAEYVERIVALNDPTFDPKTDFLYKTKSIKTPVDDSNVTPIAPRFLKGNEQGEKRKSPAISTETFAGAGGYGNAIKRSKFHIGSND